MDTTHTFNVRYSDGGLDAPVIYSADSMKMDMAENAVYLYKNASVKYSDLNLTADYIVFYMDSSEAVATGLPDSTGRMAGIPHFEEGAQAFDAVKMRYNFKTQKGIIYEAVTKEADLYIHGAKTKFVGAGSDTTIQEDHIYNMGALITTCDLAVPHYGIRSSKIKTIPSRLAVIGPSNLEINGVPTPLWLPFGFFPVTSGRRSGLLFPSNYEYSETWGFGLRDVGYYFPFSDYADLKVLGDIYFNGSWALKAQSSYKKRYRYSGTIAPEYSRRKNEIAGDYRQETTTTYSIRVNHTQDPKAHPYSKLGGSISIQTRNHNSLNYNDANSALTSSYSSNFNWNRSFPDKPYTLSIGMNHSQNTRTGQVTINAPNVDFRVNRIYPLKSQKRVGKEKWFEKISFQYTGNSRTRFMAIDSTLFTQETWDNKQFGVQHRANSDLSFDILKYLHVTPSINYEEIWFFKTTEKHFLFDEDADIVFDTIYNPLDSTDFQIVADTLMYGSVVDSIESGFIPYRHFSTGVSVNSQIFGTVQFKKGWLRGLRHIIKPTFSLFYEPETSMRYEDSVRVDIRPDRDFQQYSVLTGGLYSAPLVRDSRATLSYSFNNIFEAKFWSKKDSTEKRLKLFNNLVVGGSINLSAESFKFSPVDVRGTTRFFKGITNLSIGARFDPYEINEDGFRIDTFVLDSRGKLLRFDNAQFRLSSRFSFGQIFDLFKSEDKKEKEKQEEETDTDAEELEAGPQGQQKLGSSGGISAQSRFLDLFRQFSISHNMVISSVANPKGPVETMVNVNSINMTGSMQLTENWSIRVGNIGYDFQQKRLTYPDIGFSRNLHCWTMSFNWQPQRGTYLFHIGVNPGSLDFLKVPYSKNTQDTFGGF